jgi:nitrite reductase/ring-hydroxylating ferredoxin subunit
LKPLRLCRLDELAPGSARGFDPDGVGEDTLIVVRRPGGVRVYRNECPHQGARLEYRKDSFLSPDGTHVICYAHGARFDADSGYCVQGACYGQSLTSVPFAIFDDWICVSR